MNIPKIQHLLNQTFNSEFIEFVWLFPFKEENQRNQVIFKVSKDGWVILEEGTINNDDEYTMIYTTSTPISTVELSIEDLVSLRDEVISELKAS